ncbi:hypothetical protein JZ751_018837 [Albula glossodonta]|uniref:Uncharacterized protein n=1 Tax=Albula glossodonta TaxID=121402 RepID=A0A8T2MTY6_9TELE|nr:hypothetical protein JZ751_018837 [Albula glossodonta]
MAVYRFLLEDAVFQDVLVGAGHSRPLPYVQTLLLQEILRRLRHQEKILFPPLDQRGIFRLQKRRRGKKNITKT